MTWCRDFAVANPVDWRLCPLMMKGYTLLELNPTKKTFNYGAHTVTLETGEVARQAGGAVLVSMDDTVVLATVVARTEPKPG